ncbi:MAG: S-layer homology domain-containing protein, partial [Synechococcales cyanobacterium RM1_1_8]|nr:S-layer homology domain-containing protein [Synechococcales cyanobacterium RM1_1_8]
WAGACIERLAQRKQLNGYLDGSFRPENHLTARSMPS